MKSVEDMRKMAISKILEEIPNKVWEDIEEFAKHGYFGASFPAKDFGIEKLSSSSDAYLQRLMVVFESLGYKASFVLEKDIGVWSRIASLKIRWD